MILAGPQNLPGQFIGRLDLLWEDPLNMDISILCAQGHVLSPWSKSGALKTNNPRNSPRAHQYGSRRPANGVSKISPNFLENQKDFLICTTTIKKSHSS
jgi:hypothetical protein